MQFFRSRFPKDRVHCNVSLFRRKCWALKVMCRGSAAAVLVKQEFCLNPPLKPQKGDYIHLVNFLRRHCM